MMLFKALNKTKEAILSAYTAAVQPGIKSMNKSKKKRNFKKKTIWTQGRKWLHKQKESHGLFSDAYYILFMQCFISLPVLNV